MRSYYDTLIEFLTNFNNMKRPYRNYLDRLAVRLDTMQGSFVLLDIAWKKLIRAIVKSFLFIVLLLMLSCSKDEIQMGCESGILKTGDPNVRINFRCCTQKEYEAGSNTSIGGTAQFDLYTSVKWTPTNSCSDCN